MFYPLVVVVFLLSSTSASYKTITEEKMEFHDFGELEDLSNDIKEKSMEDFGNMRGVRHTECGRYRLSCKEFIKCTNNCESMLLDVSELERATFVVRDEDRVNAKTNPCVAMSAFCIPAPYSILKDALRLKSPFDY